MTMRALGLLGMACLPRCPSSSLVSLADSYSGVSFHTLLSILGLAISTLTLVFTVTEPNTASDSLLSRGNLAKGAQREPHVPRRRLFSRADLDMVGGSGKSPSKSMVALKHRN